MYDTADVFRKDFLYRKSNGVHDVLAEINLDVALVEPVMADELALAVADFYAGETVCFGAFQFFDVVLVVVADVLAKSRLFVEARLLPLRAVCVARVVRALVPCLEDRHGVCIVLHNHEASISVGAVEAIRVVLWFLGSPRVLCHYKRVLRLDVPVVEHPLDWDVQEAECGIGVEENNELVVLDVVCERRWLDPSSVAVFKFACMNELVVVAMDQCICVVVENTARNVVDVSPVVFALAVCIGRG